MPFCPRCGTAVPVEGDYCRKCQPEDENITRTSPGLVRQCPRCHGMGTMPCPTCLGSGQIKEVWQTDSDTGEKAYRWINCPDCRSGEVRCNYPGCNLGHI